jgi:formate dehydrogenase subunit gamma
MARRDPSLVSPDSLKRFEKNPQEVHQTRTKVETNQRRQHTPFSEEEAARLIAAEQGKRGPLLPIFHRLQEVFGYIDDKTIAPIAAALNISQAEVYGVLTFYRDFKREPSTATSIRICRAESCQAVGANELVDHAQSSLGIPIGGETSDGSIGLEQAFCFGNCALSPAIMVEDRLIGKVSNERFDAVVDAIRATV